MAADRIGVKVSILPLEEKDLEQVMGIEKQAFQHYWPLSAFSNELRNNQLASYFSAWHAEKLVGYAGLWMILDEAHITTIAVHPNYRRKKIGEQLLLHLLTIAVAKGCRWATLEVRESNQEAQELYKKFEFTSVGVRKNYYLENRENAVVMWTGNLRGESFKEKLRAWKSELEKEMEGTGHAN